MGGVTRLQRGDLDEQLAHAAVRDGGHRDDERPLAQFAPRDGRDLLDVGLGDIRLVDGDHRGAVVARRLGADRQVELAEAQGRIDDDHRDVGAVQALHAAQVRVVLHAAHLGRLAHAGRIDEAEGALLRGHGRVDGVARGAGDLADDGARLADDGVEQRRLAGVGTADDGHRDLGGRGGRHGFAGPLRAGLLDQPVEQLGGAEAVRRADDQRLAEAQLVQLLSGAHGARVVDLVGGEHHGDAPTAQHLGDLEIVGQRPGAAVDHKEHHVGRADGQLDLLADVPGVGRLLGGVVAAGVDHAHQAALPVDLDVLAVAGHARRLVDDGLTRAAEAVHEGGLAGVGRADDDDGGRATHVDSVANA